MMSLKRPSAGGESRERDSFLIIQIAEQDCQPVAMFKRLQVRQYSSSCITLFQEDRV